MQDKKSNVTWTKKPMTDAEKAEIVIGVAAVVAFSALSVGVMMMARQNRSLVEKLTKSKVSEAWAIGTIDSLIELGKIDLTSSDGSKTWRMTAKLIEKAAS